MSNKSNSKIVKTACIMHVCDYYESRNDLIGDYNAVACKDYLEVYKQELKEDMPISQLIEVINREINKYLEELKNNGEKRND